LDEKFSFFSKLGSHGQGDGEFSSPQGIAVDIEGNIYVADSSNFRIQKFNSEGFITKWGSQGNDLGQFQYPIDVEIDSDGTVYVLDQSNIVSFELS
jgi:DNA-binding beta-propeller fold protein YncE